MSHLDINSGQIVAHAAESERTAFIKRTYLHVAGSIAIFAVLETLLIQSGIAASFLHLLSGSMFSWLIVMAMFIGVSYIADKWAHSSMSREMQYAGLGLFIVAEAIVFMPMLYMAQMKAPDILMHAALLTGVLVAAISFTAFTTKINFSFLGKYLMFGGFIAIGMIAAAVLFGFSLGVWFAGAMVLFAGVSVLYNTSNMIHEYHTEQHVAAALGLFSSIALMFYYIVTLLMSLGGDD